MSRQLATVSNPALVSRNDELAVVRAGVIDFAVHVAGAILARGLFLVKTIGNSKFRAYAEGTVKSGGAFATNAATFTLDLALQALAVHFRVGDVIEDTAGNALGTIATYNPVTGVGTLTGNSTSALAAAGKVRIALSQVSLAGLDGRLLTDEVSMLDSDVPASMYTEGYFLAANTTVTAAAVTAMGVGRANLGTVELRLK